MARDGAWGCKHLSLAGRLFASRPFNHPLVRPYVTIVQRDLSAAYSRDIQKWLLVAPVIGIVTGLTITLLTSVLLDTIWARVLVFYLRHHWMIIPGLAAGFALTGLIMQRRTPNPNVHSTEEIVASYHEHQGDIDVRPFWWKLLAAVTTVGSGGSAALEGPSIYSGGAIGSWLWTKLRPLGLTPRDRRLMLISGAAAGMGAVFRAPLTGLVFALEMPYRDDLAHEALLPSLISSVVAYATLAILIGAEPLFKFAGTVNFRASELGWSALLGVIIGVIGMAYAITFRHVRNFAINAPVAHWRKLLIGGVLTGVFGVIFLMVFPGILVPIGPNYEAVREILTHPHSTSELIFFALGKMASSICSIGCGGVSAVFVPAFLTGGAIGSAYAQIIGQGTVFDLYAAVGMAAFIAAAYTAPLTAVVFVAEVTGGHSFIIPSLIGAACAYAISGEASISADQRLHEEVRLSGLVGVPVREVMQRKVITVAAGTSLKNFAASIAANHTHDVFPVCDEHGPIATIAVWTLSTVPPERWEMTPVEAVASKRVTRIEPDDDIAEALRLLDRESADRLLIIGQEKGPMEGIVTKTDILRAWRDGSGEAAGKNHGGTR
jgi:CIC family chloride channel protein